MEPTRDSEEARLVRRGIARLAGCTRQYDVPAVLLTVYRTTGDGVTCVAECKRCRQTAYVLIVQMAHTDYQIIHGWEAA